MNDPIIIVGAGLSGLHAASILTAKGISCIVLEVRDRIGGRVLSEGIAERPELGKFDLGPTWFWPQHEPAITRLVNEFNIEVFEQHTEGKVLFEQSQSSPVQRLVLPEGADPKSVRIVGGVSTLVDAIAATVPENVIELSTRVLGFGQDNEGKVDIQIQCADGEKKSLRAKAVILALPPRIVAQDIDFSPQLPANVKRSLEEKSTWMGGQAKVVAVYERPFWRADGLSGQAISRGGLLQEIHDASPKEGNGALFGFFGMPPKQRQALGEEKVLELVIAQLVQLFGTAAGEPISMLYKDWSSDIRTAVEADAEPLTAFSDYALPITCPVWEGKIFFAGTETSAENGGHLEGALLSAERAVSSVLELIE